MSERKDAELAKALDDNAALKEQLAKAEAAASVSSFASFTCLSCFEIGEHLASPCHVSVHFAGVTFTYLHLLIPALQQTRHSRAQCAPFP